MKKFLISILLFLSFSVAAVSDVKVITLAGPGSQSDTAARYFAPLIEKEMNKNVIIQNVPGASGIIGIRHFLQIPKDNYSLVIGNSNLGYIKNTNGTLEFDPMEDLEPIYGLAISPILILVSSNSPVNDLKDLKDLYQKNKRLLGGSIAAVSNIMIDGMDHSLGVKTDIVNYRLAQEMSLNTSAGIIDFFTAAAGNSAAQGLLDAGKLKVIGIIGDYRSLQYPDVKTIKEQGFKEIEDFSWIAFFVNKNTPVSIKQEMKTAIEKIMNSKESVGYENLPGKPRRWIANSNTVRNKQLQELKLLK